MKISRIYCVMMIALIAGIFSSCKTVQVETSTFSPYGDVGAFVEASIPLGATDTTQTTQSPGPAVRADNLDAEINRLMESLEHPDVKADNLLYDSTLEEIADKTRLRDALIKEANQGAPPALVFDEETPDGREPAPEPKGFLGSIGSGILTAGHFVKDGFFDYSSKTEGAKSAAGTGLVAWGLGYWGNRNQWWQINEIGGAVHNTGGTDTADLATAATALANRDATTVDATGSGNNFRFTDLPQDTQLKVNVTGNNNSAEFDFQRDTQGETSVTVFRPAPTFSDEGAQE